MAELPQPNFPVYDRPASIVEAQIDAMSERADAALGVANQAIAALSMVEFPPEMGAPNFSLGNIDLPNIEDPAPPSTLAFGEIDDFNAPGFQTLDDLLAGLTDLATIPEFEPGVASINVPPTPAPIDTSGAPTRPTIAEITVPDDPYVEIPELEPFVELNIPTFTMPEFPVFEDVPVVFEGSAPSTVIQWAEPVYASEVLDDLKREIRRCLAGGTGMTAAVEAALFSRARSRETAVGLRRQQEAFDRAGARGFDMPPGAAFADQHAVQEEVALKELDLSREILAKSAEWEQENLRNAIVQGVALETVLINQHENLAKRVFDAAKTRLEGELRLFDSFVTLFNAKQSARTVAVEVFKAKTGEIQIRLDAYKAQLEGEATKGQINEVRARAYAARVDAMRNIVAVFEARVQAVKARSDVERAKIDLYRGDIDAYAARLNARKVEFEAFGEIVRAEAAKAGIVEANARAFAATVEAISSNNNVKIAAVRARADVILAAVQKFQALLQAERERIASQATAITARAQAFSADVGRYSAQLQRGTEEARLRVTLAEARLRNNLAFYEIRVREFDQLQSRLVEKTRVQVGAISAAGGMASNLAAGAFSAMHVQASLSGNGSASTSSSYSRSDNYNHDVED